MLRIKAEHEFVYTGQGKAFKGTVEEGALFWVGPRYLEYTFPGNVDRTYFRVSGDLLYVYEGSFDNLRHNLATYTVYRRVE
jgi:hypothetical protein